MNGLAQFVNAALVNCVNLLTYERHAFCHSPLILYALKIYIHIYYMRMICIFAYVFTCMHACIYACVYARIGGYACMYMCTLMFLILICVCILSYFRTHNHHLSPNDSPRLMYLFVDCATVNKVYLILSYLITALMWRHCNAQTNQRKGALFTNMDSL